MATIKRSKPWQSSPKKHDPFYDSPQWRLLTGLHKADNPFCYYCQKEGRLTIGTTSDHVLPRRFFPELELDRTNLKTICPKCDGKKRQVESTCTSKADCFVKLKDYLR